MSDESPTKRLSQIFESLSCLSEIHKNQQKEQPNYGNTSSSSSSSVQIQPSHYSVPSTPLSSTSNQNTKINSSGQRVLIGSRSTPNSPRLMPKRSRPPPAIPQRPHAALIASPALATMDVENSPWTHFTSLTDHLDVHQVNNYHQGLPEVSFFFCDFFLLNFNLFKQLTD